MVARRLLNIVTAVSRPENLRFIQRHLTERLPSFEVRWYCVVDTNHGPVLPEDLTCHWNGSSSQRDRAGGAHRNVALDQITDGWVYFLDDDNTIHPQLDHALTSAIAAAPDFVGHVFGQADGAGRPIRQPTADTIRCGRVDLGQFALSRDAIGATRFPADIYHSDWLFFEPIWREHRRRIGFGPTATFYNALADSPAGFRSDWFSQNRRLFDRHLGPLRDRSNLRGLEIGAFEGRSTCWLLEHIVTSPDSQLDCIEPFLGVPECANAAAAAGIGLEERFLRNIRRHQHRLRLIKERSRTALPKLTAETFDFAYVDGSHRAVDVLRDFIQVLRLLKPGRVLIGDDYGWKLNPRPVSRPKLGIDAFLRRFGRQVDVLHLDYAIVLRKR